MFSHNGYELFRDDKIVAKYAKHEGFIYLTFLDVMTPWAEAFEAMEWLGHEFDTPVRIKRI